LKSTARTRNEAAATIGAFLASNTLDEADKKRLQDFLDIVCDVQDAADFWRRIDDRVGLNKLGKAVFKSSNGSVYKNGQILEDVFYEVERMSYNILSRNLY